MGENKEKRGILFSFKQESKALLCPSIAWPDGSVLGGLGGSETY